MAWIGLDWGHHTHAFVLQDGAGPPEEGTLPHTAESLHAWLRDLEKRFGGRSVALAIGPAAAPSSTPWSSIPG